MLMSGKQLSLDSRIDLVQRLVTDKDGSNPQIDESCEGLVSPTDIDEILEGTFRFPFNICECLDCLIKENFHYNLK